MKTKIILFAVMYVILSVLVVTADASEKRINVGVGYGAASVYGGQHANYLSGDFSYRFKEHMAVRMDIGRASTTSKFASTSQYFSSTDETTYTLFPAEVSFLYYTPVNNRLSAYLGIGAGYYSLSLKQESQDFGISPEPMNTSQAYKIHSWAPHVCIGFEAKIYNYAGIFGEVNYVTAKSKFTSNEATYSNEQDINYGGPQLKVGIRFQFGNN
jgi:Outer membrane protein beta-barrel domain